MKTNMIHIENEVYEALAQAIKSGYNGWWISEDERFTATISTSFHSERVYTGVEFMGARESYLEDVLDEWSVSDFCAWDENDEECPCDFKESNITL